MKSGIPWNLKAVDPETREAVIAAARRAGMSVGEWLNQVLAADGEGYAEPEESAQARTPAAPPPTLSSAIAQLKTRLDAIEQNVKQADRRRLPPGQPARAQKSVRDMIADLAREIENPDESARSMVEGLRQRTAPPVRPVKDSGIDDAIRSLDERIAGMGQRAQPQAPEGRPPRLDDIRNHLDALLAQAPRKPAAEPAAQATLIDAALRALEGRIDDARAEVAQRDAGTSAAAATAEHVARIETRLADIGDRLAAIDADRTRPQKEAELASAIREIAVHQRSIDERAETFAIRRDQKALAAAMAALRTDIASLGEQVSAISQVGSEGHGAVYDIARRMDALAAEAPHDRTMLAAIREDLDRLGGLIDRTPERGRIEELGEDIAALRRALEKDDSPRAIQRLEMHVAELSRAVEAALNHRHAAAPANDQAVARLESRLQEIVGQIDSLRDSDTIASIEQRLEGRLNEMASRLVGGLMDTTSHAAAIELAQQRLETRLEDVAAQLGGLADAVPQTNLIEAAQQQLESRLEEIVGRLGGMVDSRPHETIADVHERLQQITERIDTLTGQHHAPAAALDAVKAEISALRAEVAGQAAPPPSTEHLEDQIRALAAQLETVTLHAADNSALAELEERVTTLASELEQAPRADSLRDVEDSLGRLQSLLADTTRESIAGARAEARRAVTELSEVVARNDIDSDLVRGLARDLETLKAAIGDPDSATRNRLDSVGETLTQVVDRLSRLETEAVSAARYAEPAPARPVPTPVRDVVPPRRNEETPVSAPDNPADRRADFIAAARRAAQAATARIAADEYSTPRTPQAVETAAPDAAPEADAPAAPQAAERKPGAFSRISRAVRSRRPLLLAAAAIVLAIGAMQVYGRLSIPPKDPAFISTADTVVTAPAAPEVREVAAAAPAPAPLPVAAPATTTAALVPPSAQPDTAVAFAEPSAEPTRFDDRVTAPPPAAFSSAAATEPLDATTTATIAPAPAAADAAATAVASPQSVPGVQSGLDPRIGSDKLLSAADTGDPAAAFEIATRYAEGTRVPKDLAAAARWYGKAAEGGVAVAQYRLGSLYERGQGVQRDLISAVDWYQRAADQGNINAMHNLAVLMSEGVEGNPDHDKALQWFLAAGNYGVRDSQYNLGVIYARGLGPQQDLEESYKWFAIAASQGDTDAASRRDEVAKAMTADDLAKARAAVAAWHVKPPLAEANAVMAPAGGWDGPGELLGEADRQALVKTIQTLLADQGYDPGPADGVVGPKTVEAVRAYQRNLGQPETGHIDNALVAALSDTGL